jgi:DNA-binding transcriptional regulator YbjK
MSMERDAAARTMPGPPIQRREAKQDRSALRQKRITEGAIIAISRYGIAGVTHRRVAQEAHVSLAATTYHYQTKNDIIIDASRALLARYVDAFHRFADRHRDPADRIAFRDFVLKLVFNAVGKHSVETLAWCEIIVNTARQPELRDLSRAWFVALDDVWREIAQLLGAQDIPRAVTSAIDTVIGFLFSIVPLGLSESELRELLSIDLANFPAELFKAAELPAGPVRAGRKAEETRERILNAAVAILIESGTEALSFRHVSEKAGLTIAAPTYYFSSISVLLNAAQLQMFEQSKNRYRAVMSNAEYAKLDAAHLIDLTTTVFLREATEYRSLSLACYPLYIQSSRDPSLRPGLWAIDTDQLRRWMQVLAQIAPGSTPLDAWLIYASFIGKLIRVLATGAETSALSAIRGEFAYEIGALAEKRHWSTAS